MVCHQMIEIDVVYNLLKVKDNNMAVKFTVKEFASTNTVTPLAAQGLITYLVAKGLVKKVDKQRTANGKGKPSTVYEFPDELTLKFV